MTTRKSAKPASPASFETNLEELENIVAELEQGNLALDASVERFRKASELANTCKTMITKARLRVTELQADQSTAAPSDEASDDVPF
ncbi:MAG: exodeoxyribonuclease VII small subunit [Thermomicrobiales bacterium]